MDGNWPSAGYWLERAAQTRVSAEAVRHGYTRQCMFALADGFMRMAIKGIHNERPLAGYLRHGKQQTAVKAGTGGSDP